MVPSPLRRAARFLPEYRNSSYYLGNTAVLTGSSPYVRLIAVHPETGEGMIGIYEAREPGEIPEPATLAWTGLGLLAAAWLRRR